MATTNHKHLTKRALGILGAVLGAEVIICTGLAMSVHTKKVALEKTLAGKESALTDIRTVSASLPDLQDEYGKMLAQVRYLERSLPEPEYIPTLLGEIERTAAASGVRIMDFRPKVDTASSGSSSSSASGSAAASSGSGGATQQSFDMTVTGRYGQVQTFLQNLTRFRKILALNSIRLQPAAGGKAQVSPDLTASLNLTAFVLPPDAADAPSTVPAANPQPDRKVTASAALPAAAKMAQQHGITVSQPASRG